MNENELPFSPAAERNKTPILAFLEEHLADARLRVLEVGSGTGQHAAHFASRLPNVVWQTGDLRVHHAAISARVAAAGLPNLLPPVDIDASRFDYNAPTDIVFTANTLHIMSWENGCRLLEAVGQLLRPGGRLIVYGPFKVGGRPTSESNVQFDHSLRAAHPDQGLRHREQVCWRADDSGLSLRTWRAMPANNQILLFERRANTAARVD